MSVSLVPQRYGQADPGAQRPIGSSWCADRAAGRTAVWRFFNRHKISFKKRVYARRSRIARMWPGTSMLEATAICRTYQHVCSLALGWLRLLEGESNCARADLDEKWDIAERRPMRLHMADIYLQRARLFFREKRYPWKSPQDDLVAAEKLINDCAYHRRDEELSDAKSVILTQ
jgi:hypothetical protein